MRIALLASLVWKRLFSSDKNERLRINYIIAQRVSDFLYPFFCHTEEGKVWLEDGEFINYYKKFETKNFRSLDRKFMLKSLLSLVKDLDGDTAECGVYKGATSYLICNETSHRPTVHYAIDSFEGLSTPTGRDAAYWKKGDLKAGVDECKENLRLFEERIRYCKGWIPEVFHLVKSPSFRFVHVDVDLYAPTHNSLEFFYEKMVPGGIIVCDDYGFKSCEGAKIAVDEFFAGKPEPVVHSPTGQAIIIKKEGQESARETG